MTQDDKTNVIVIIILKNHMACDTYLGHKVFWSTETD